MYILSGIVTLMALGLYYALALKVGLARAQYNIPAPQITGSPEFEQVFRVHQNMLEQLVFFLPSLWLFSFFVNPVWGAGLGVVWVVGRGLYAWGYYQAPEKRGIGFGISSLASLALFLGVVVGMGLEVARSGLQF